MNRGRTNAYDLGDGYGHVAFVVDDIASEHARFEREGLHPGPLKEMQRNGKQFARFFFVQDPDGYKFCIWPVRVRLPFDVRLRCAWTLLRSGYFTQGGSR